MCYCCIKCSELSNLHDVLADESDADLCGAGRAPPALPGGSRAHPPMASLDRLCLARSLRPAPLAWGSSRARTQPSPASRAEAPHSHMHPGTTLHLSNPGASLIQGFRVTESPASGDVQVTGRAGRHTLSRGAALCSSFFQGDSALRSNLINPTVTFLNPKLPCKQSRHLFS